MILHESYTLLLCKAFSMSPVMPNVIIGYCKTRYQQYSDEMPVIQKHYTALLAHSVYIPAHAQRMFSFRSVLTVEFLQLPFSIHLLHILLHHPNPLLAYSATSLFKIHSLLTVQHCLIVRFPIQDIQLLKNTQQ